MRRRFPVIIPVLFLLGALMLGSALFGRNTVRQGENRNNQQARNFVGWNMPGTRPDNGNLTRYNPMGVNPTPGLTNRDTRQEIRQPMVFDKQRTDNLISQLRNVDGIRDINAIVRGNTAIVGYNPTDAGTDANAIRKTITERVRQLDNTITNVVVSGSADISSNINRLWENIRANKPFNDLGNEYDQLLGNINSARS